MYTLSKSTDRGLKPTQLFSFMCMQFYISVLLCLASSSNYEPKSISAAEEVSLNSDPHSADVPSVAMGVPGSPANNSTAVVTRGSATSTNPTSSFGETFSSLGTRTHRHTSSREATDLPAPPEKPLLTSSLSASESTFRGKFVSLKVGCFVAGWDFASPCCFSSDMAISRYWLRGCFCYWLNGAGSRAGGKGGSGSQLLGEKVKKHPCPHCR